MSGAPAAPSAHVDPAKATKPPAPSPATASDLPPAARAASQLMLSVTGWRDVIPSGPNPEVAVTVTTRTVRPAPGARVAGVVEDGAPARVGQRLLRAAVFAASGRDGSVRDGDTTGRPRQPLKCDWDRGRRTARPPQRGWRAPGGRASKGTAVDATVVVEGGGTERDRAESGAAGEPNRG
ncbi:MAG: hypothetical protein AMXMBFR64_40260 [Myxococcales bacterium]